MYGFAITDGRLISPGHHYQPGEGVHVCADLAEYNGILALDNPCIVNGSIVDAPPARPPVPPAILDLADQILSTWSQTKLHVPADWDEATALLEASPDPDILRLAIRLLALRLRLSEAGGTWQHVLDRASTTSTTSTKSTTSTN